MDLPTEMAFYQKNGYVIPDYRLGDTTLARLTAATAHVLDHFTDFKPEDLINMHMIRNANGEHKNPFLDVATDAHILDRVESILGPDIVLWLTRVLCKPARIGREIPWHQDGEYWPIKPLKTCTVWIAIDAVDRRNGCMRMIPGFRERLIKHRMSDRTDVVLNVEVDNTSHVFDEQTAVDIVLPPGGMSIHDAYTIHGSSANTSERRRAAYLLRFMSASSYYDRDSMKNFRDNRPFKIENQPLFLLRGRNACAANDFAHGHAQWTEYYQQYPLPDF